MKKKNIKIKNLISNQKGMALLTTLIFVFILVTFGVSLLTMTGNDSKMSTLQRDSTRAFYQADAGIEKAIWYLNSSEENEAGLNYEGPLNGGTTSEYYEVTVGPIISGTPETKTLISTGKVVGGGEFNKGTRKIEVKLIKRITPVQGLSYKYAVLTDDDMDINGGISIHGNIHSNGNIDISNPDIFTLNGEATACGYNDYPDGHSDQSSQTLPIVDMEHFKGLVIDPDNPLNMNENENGKYYGYDNSVVFDDDVPLTLCGTHFVDGDIVIKSDIILDNATIFATGTIRVLGGGDITLNNTLEDHPLALIAYGNITIGGAVHGEGIIQTIYGDFTNNGCVDINEGAIYANEGTFNGGGWKEFNVKYGTALATMPVHGTGIPVWKKISWREVYL